MGAIRRRAGRNLGVRHGLPRLLVGPAEVRRRAEDRAADPHRRPGRGVPRALPGRPRGRPAPLQLPRQRYPRHRGQGPGARHRAGRHQPGQPELAGSVPAPQERPRHRHPGRPASRGAAGGHAARRAARARHTGLVRPDRAPCRRPGRRDAAVHRGPGRPARSRRGRRRRADLARRQADPAGARGRPAPRRAAAPPPLHPRRRQRSAPRTGSGRPCWPSAGAHPGPAADQRLDMGVDDGSQRICLRGVPSVRR